MKKIKQKPQHCRVSNGEERGMEQKKSSPMLLGSWAVIYHESKINLVAHDQHFEKMKQNTKQKGSKGLSCFLKAYFGYL